ncbi:MAG: hypothetical protein WCS43_10135 [Verrucomicrobiota bacterium]
MKSQIVSIASVVITVLFPSQMRSFSATLPAIIMALNSKEITKSRLF